MKALVFGLLIGINTVTHAASIFSDSYTLDFEFNRHSKISDFKLVLDGSCAKKDILKVYNRCPVELSRGLNERVHSANKNSQYKIKSLKVEGKGGVLRSPRLEYNLGLTNKAMGDTLPLGIFNFTQENRNNSDITGLMRDFANKTTLYVTTIPSFAVESSIHLNIDSLRVKIDNCWLTKNENTPCFEIYLDSQMVDRDLKTIEYPRSLTYFTVRDTPRILNDYDWKRTGDRKKLSNGNTLKTYDTNAYMTYERPHAFKLELTYNISYLGKSKTIKLAPIIVDDLDNIDLTHEIGVVELEVNDTLN